MASTPPIAAGLSGIKQAGYTRICWGTEAFGANLANSAGSSYIVKAFRSGQSVEKIPLTQGSGLTAIMTYLIDGQHTEWTVAEDLNIAPPPATTVVILQNVFVSNIGSSTAPFGNTAVANVGQFTIENNDFSVDEKAYGQRVFACSAYVAMNTTNGGGNPAIGT